MRFMFNAWVLALSLSMSLPVFANTTRPIQSLNDLPSRWEGVAGDLLARVSATLTIDRIKKASRTDKPKGFVALYEVDGTVSFGERKVIVSKIELTVNTADATPTYSFFVMTEDQLTPNLWAALVYDEATDTFTMKEYPRAGGDRRFVFQARVNAN